MIKVSVMYPYRADARFNHDYYRDTHMPLVKARMGDACLFYTVDRGLTGSAPGQPPMFVAQGHIHCESVEAFQRSFGPHAREITADVANYTNLEPVLMISEVVAS